MKKVKLCSTFQKGQTKTNSVTLRWTLHAQIKPELVKHKIQRYSHTQYQLKIIKPTFKLRQKPCFDNGSCFRQHVTCLWFNHNKPLSNHINPMVSLVTLAASAPDQGFTFYQGLDLPWTSVPPGWYTWYLYILYSSYILRFPDCQLSSASLGCFV